jgi:putative peptidoglycan binding protein
MEAREHRDPGYDDWFDEPEPPTETQSVANRAVYEDADEVWVLPEDEDERGPGQREIVIGGRALTTTQLAIIAVSVLAVFFGILAAFGVFNGSKTSAPPVILPKPKKAISTKTSTAPAPSTAAVPSQPLKLGDIGPQVKILQRALNKLGFSTGTPDGDFGPSTQTAVEQFQASQKLGVDGYVGTQTIAALKKALGG